MDFHLHSLISLTKTIFSVLAAFYTRFHPAMERRKPEFSPGKENSFTGSDCGDKFREMLKCVERGAAIPPCTHLVNKFLACERAVFQSALNAQPPRTSRSAQSRTLPNSGDIHRQDYSNDKNELSSTAPPGGSVGTERGTVPQKCVDDRRGNGIENGKPSSQQPASEWLIYPSQSTLDFVQHVIEKQSQACVTLVHVVSQPDYTHRLPSFCKRIAQDIHLSFSLVVQKLMIIARPDGGPKN